MKVILSAITSILFILLALFVWIKQHRPLKIKLFVISCTALAFVSLRDLIEYQVSDYVHYLIAVKLLFSVYIGLAYFLLEFTWEFLDFTQKNRIMRVLNTYIVLLFLNLNITNLIIGGARSYNGGYTFVPGRLYFVFIIYCVSIMLLCITKVLKAYNISKSNVQKKRIFYIIMGFGVILIGIVIDSLRRFDIFTLVDFPILNLTFLVFFIILAYDILKYKLLGLIIKKSIYITVMGAIIAAMFEILIWSMDKIVLFLTGTTSNWVSLLAVLICAFSFDPIKKKVHELVSI